MKPEHISEEIKNRLDFWYGKTPYSILHWWEQDGTYFVCSKSKEELRFIRVFPVGRGLGMSIDNAVSI